MKRNMTVIPVALVIAMTMISGVKAEEIPMVPSEVVPEFTPAELLEDTDSIDNTETDECVDEVEENLEEETPDEENVEEEIPDQSSTSETDLDQLGSFAEQIADAIGDGDVGGETTIPDDTSSGSGGTVSEEPVYEEPIMEEEQEEVWAETENDTEQKYVMEDIENVLRKVTETEEHKNSLYEFDKFYKYMRNIGLRYNRSIEVLSIEIINSSAEDTGNIDEEISDMLQVAIRKNIRAVDVYYKYSEEKHMLILLDAGIDNIDIIQQRILFDFNSNISSEGYTLQFSLNESIESKK